MIPTWLVLACVSVTTVFAVFMLRYQQRVQAHMGQANRLYDMVAEIHSTVVVGGGGGGEYPYICKKE